MPDAYGEPDVHMIGSSGSAEQGIFIAQAIAWKGHRGLVCRMHPVFCFSNGKEKRNDESEWDQQAVHDDADERWAGG